MAIRKGVYSLFGTFLEKRNRCDQLVKMNDLLAQSYPARNNGRGGDDLESGPSTQMANFGGEQDLTKFFDEVEKIKVDMDKIKQLLVKLQEANEESKGVHKAQAMKGIRDRMDKDIAQVNKIARSIKAKLEDLDKGNAASRKVKGCEEGTPTDRTRMSITNNQRKKLKDLMGEFQVLRERMMNEYKETIERRSFAIYTLIVSAHEFGKFWLNFCRLHAVDLSSLRIRFATKSLS